MASSGQGTGGTSRRRSTLSRLGIALLVLAVAAAGLWLARKPIARGFVDRTFAEAHVPARYTIEELAFGHQRLTDIVIGDPKHPDLIADWVELETIVGLNGARVVGVSAGNVRVRGQVVDGALSLGSLDRLIPKGSGGAFRLPAIALKLDDGRMRLDTPQGAIGIKATGSGRLDGGFRGAIAAVTDRVASGACVADKAVAALTVDIRQDAIRLNGPLRAATAGCAGNGAKGLRADIAATISPTFDHWNGTANLAADNASAPATTFADLAGTLSFVGTTNAVQGKAALTADRLAGAGMIGQAGKIDGTFRYAGGKGAFAGQARIERAALPAAMRARLASIGGAGAGTPIAPLTAQLAKALDTGAQEFAITGDLSAATDGGRGSVKLSRLIAVAESGASVTLTSRDGTQFVWPNGGAIVRGDVLTGGGGLPEISATLAQTGFGAPVTGVATIEPYEAGGARLAMAPVKFSAGLDGRTRIESIVTLTGPIGGGSVEGLSLPIIALWDGRGTLSVNPSCAALSAARLHVGGLDARQVRTELCPVEGAMFRLAGGRIGGGASARDVRLAGLLGESPLTLAADSAIVRLSDKSFQLGKIAVRLGTTDRLTRFDVATLNGGFGEALAGKFGGAAGQIGAVPLLLSNAAGNWRYAGGRLVANGALLVADAAAGDPRFKPLAATNIALTLADSRIVATGILSAPRERNDQAGAADPTTALKLLAAPEGGVKVADLTIAHDLSDGRGSADLIVAGLRFTPDFQPKTLTPLTLGVISDVAGVVTGEGHVRWTSDQVTSDGVFRTHDTALAAAFGQVAGLTTEVRFTDLLGMVSAPDQRATVNTVDTGITVGNGLIRYQVLGPSSLKVSDALWPFAGGQLSLEPTILDFADDGGRHLTFRLAGVDAGQFLQQFEFKNINASGIFDGTLPMIFDSRGGRIENGHLAVRKGGGTLAYIGEVTNADLGVWGNLAFQALKSLKYRTLDLTMNGPLTGEVITEARFAGISQGAGAKSNFLIRRLQKLPFAFNVKIRAPFRALMESAQTYYDPGRHLLGQLQKQNSGQRPVQPPASEKKP